MSIRKLSRKLLRCDSNKMTQGLIISTVKPVPWEQEKVAL
jgi:hypothetical protein